MLDAAFVIPLKRRGIERDRHSASGGQLFKEVSVEINFSMWIEILKLQLAAVGFLQIKPQGKSMYPLMETDDTITIIRKDEYKVGDIVLYTKKERLILHRIIYKTEEGIYILVGDNAHGYEDQAADFEILGAAEQIIDTNQKEKEISDFPLYNYAAVKYAHVFRHIRNSPILGERIRYIVYRILHFLFYGIPVIIYRLECRGIHGKRERIKKI